MASNDDRVDLNELLQFCDDSDVDLDTDITGEEADDLLLLNDNLCEFYQRSSTPIPGHERVIPPADRAAARSLPNAPDWADWAAASGGLAPDARLNRSSSSATADSSPDSSSSTPFRRVVRVS